MITVLILSFIWYFPKTVSYGYEITIHPTIEPTNDIMMNQHSQNILYLRKYGCDYGYCWYPDTDYSAVCDHPYVIGGAVSKCCTTNDPSLYPTADPTINPSIPPTVSPSSSPSKTPSFSPTFSPLSTPTSSQTSTPSISQSLNTSASPTNSPSFSPTDSPSTSPTPPTTNPTRNPSIDPTGSPTLDPTLEPTYKPSTEPTAIPTMKTEYPTNHPSYIPTSAPTYMPTCKTVEYVWKCFQGIGGVPGHCHKKGYNGNGKVDIGQGFWNWPYQLIYTDNLATITGQGVESTTLNYIGGESYWIGCKSDDCWLEIEHLALASNNTNYKQINIHTGGTLILRDILFDGNNYNVNMNGDTFWTITDASVSVLFEDCIISNNDVKYEFLSGSKTTFVNCTFKNNHLTLKNGFSLLDAMLYINNANVIFINCSFNDNILVNRKLLSITNTSNVKFQDCIFSSNNATFNAYSGPIIYVDHSTVMFDNCTFRDNKFSATPLIESENTANISIVNTEFVNNFANLKTGLILLNNFVDNVSIISIVESTFFKNMDFVSLLAVLLSESSQTVNQCPSELHRTIRIISTTWIDNNCNYMTCNSLGDATIGSDKANNSSITDMNIILLIIIICLLVVLILILMYIMKIKYFAHHAPEYSNPNIDNQTESNDQESNEYSSDTEEQNESEELTNSNNKCEAQSSTSYSHLSQSADLLGER